MLRRGGLLFVLALLAAGCSIDRVEWESKGSSGRGRPARAPGGARRGEPGRRVHPARGARCGLGVPRTRGRGRVECEVKTHPHEKVIRDIVCEREEEEPRPAARGGSARRALTGPAARASAPRRCMVRAWLTTSLVDPRLGATPGAEAVGRGPSDAKKASRHDYHHPAAAWGAARSVGRVLWKAREPIEGPRAVLRMNHEDKGFDCPGCAWPDDPNGLHLDICENGIKHVTWEMTREEGRRRLLRRAHRDRAAGLERLRARGPGPPDRAARLRRGDATPTSRSPGRTPSRSSARRSAASPARTRRPSTPRAGSATRRRSSTSSGCASSARTTCPDCSNMCHEASGRALERVARHRQGHGATSSTGRQADAIFVIGVNAASNAPRMLTCAGRGLPARRAGRARQPARSRRPPRAHDRAHDFLDDGDVPCHADRARSTCSRGSPATWRSCAASPRRCSRRPRRTRRRSTATFLDELHDRFDGYRAVCAARRGTSSSGSRASTRRKIRKLARGLPRRASGRSSPGASASPSRSTAWTRSARS